MNPGVPKTRTASFEPVGRDPLADLRPVLENARKFCARRGFGPPAEARKKVRDEGAAGTGATAEPDGGWASLDNRKLRPPPRCNGRLGRTCGTSAWPATVAVVGIAREYARSAL